MEAGTGGSAGIARGVVLQHTGSHHGARRAALVALALALIALIGLAAGPGIAQAAGSCDAAGAKVWSAGAVDNDWFNANNWVPAGVPGAGSNVCIQNAPPGGKVVIGTGANTSIGSLESSQPLEITSGTLTLSSTTQQSDMHSTLTLNGGNLAGAGNLSVDGSLVWLASSTMTGTGATIVTSAGTLAFSGSDFGTRQLRGNRTLTLNGTGTWSGTNFLCLDTGGKFIVASGGAMSITNNQQLFACGGGGAALVSILSGGSLSKSGAATTNIGVPFENDGATSTSQGTLSLDAGSGTGSHSGTWTAASGSGIDLTAGTHNAAPLAVDGAGKLRVNGATLNLTGAGTVDAASTFQLSSGTVQGAGGLTVGGTLLWDGDSTMTGVGDTTIAPAGTLTINTASNTGDRRLTSDRTLALNGSGTWSGTSNMCLAGGASLDVAGSLTTNNAQFAYNCTGLGAPPKINVLAGGTLTKGTGGTTNLSVPFENDGDVVAAAGSLSLDGGSGAGSHSGTWTPAAGATIDIPSGATHNAAPLPLDGAGKLRLNGTLNLTGAGTVDPASTLELASGTLQGTGNLTVDGTLLWSGDTTMTGAGDTTIAPAGTLTINNSVTSGDRRLTSDRSLVLNGTGTWSGSNNICIGSGASLDVAGSLTASNAQFLYNCIGTGAAPKLSVLAGGSLTKSAGGTTNVSVPFDNDGDVDVDAGILSLDGGSGTNSHSGTWTAAAGATIDVPPSGATTTANPLPLDGAGKLRVNGGTLNLTGSGTVDPASTLELAGGILQGAGNLAVDGALLWSGDSTMTGTGDTTIAPAGTLTINNGFSGGDRRLTAGRTLSLNSAGTWSAINNICIASGANLDIAGSLSSTNAQFVYNCLGVGVGQLNVLAGGELAKASGGGTTTVSIPYSNAGTTRVSSGKLDLQGTFSNYNSATKTLTGGAYVVTNSSSLQFNNADVVTNAADITLSGANARFLDQTGTANGLRSLAVNAAAGRLELLSGRNLTVPGAFTNNGTLALGPTSTFTTTGNYSQSASGRLKPRVEGTTPGTNVGHLVSGGAAVLDGELSIDTPSMPPPDTQAQIVTSTGPRTGTFSSVKGAAGYNVEYLANAVRLVSTTIPELAVTDASVLEGDAGTTTANLKVKLSSARPTPVTFKWQTLNNSATTPADYASVPLTTVTFAPGEVEKTLPVTVNGDTLNENDESFTVRISAPTGAAIVDNLAAGRILDEEGPLFASVADTSLSEGNAGTTPAQFAVTLSSAPPPGQTVSMNYTTANATATVANGDYVAESGTLTFSDATGATQMIDVDVNGDTTVEPNQKFKLNLSSPTSGLLLADPGATATIRNDDGTPGAVVKPSISVSNAKVLEPDAGTATASFDVTLSAASAGTVTAKYVTANSTALAPGDYTHVPLTTLTFAPGEVTKTVTVDVAGDTLKETTEQFQVKLSGLSGAVAGDATGLGYILDDEGPLSISIGDVHIAEGDSGTRNAVMTVSIPEPQQAGVTFAVTPGSATNPDDYTNPTNPDNTLNFTSTVASRVITVPIVGDGSVEGDETFSVTLSAPKNAVLGDATGVFTIHNDD